MNKSEQAVAVFDKRAHDYQSRYMDVSGYSDTLDFICERLSSAAHIFDIACGPGNIARYLLQKRPDLQITGSDLAPNMIALAKANNPNANFLQMDMRDIGKVKKADAIVCGFGLPYLSKEEAIAFICALPQALTPHGLVYLSTMEGNYNASRVQKSSDGADEIFIHYHQKDYLVAALKTAGFEILLEKMQDFAGNSDIDLILIARWNP